MKHFVRLCHVRVCFAVVLAALQALSLPFATNRALAAVGGWKGGSAGPTGVVNDWSTAANWTRPINGIIAGGTAYYIGTNDPTYNTVGGLTLSYSGNPSYDPGFNIGHGTLYVEHGTLTITATVSIGTLKFGSRENSGTLYIGGINHGGSNNFAPGDGTLVVAGIVHGSDTFINDIHVNSGTLDLGYAATYPAIPVNHSIDNSHVTLEFTGGTIQNLTTATVTSFGTSSICSGTVANLTSQLTLNLGSADGTAIGSANGTFIGNVTGAGTSAKVTSVGTGVITFAPAGDGTVGPMSLVGLTTTGSNTIFKFDEAAVGTGDLLTIGAGGLNLSGAAVPIKFGTKPVDSGNYKLIANIGAATLANFSLDSTGLPVGSFLSTTQDAGYLDLVVPAANVPTGSGIWKNQSGDNKWTTNTGANNNWATGIPLAADNIATFDDNVFNLPGTVDLDGDKTVGGVVLNTSSLSYTLGLTPGGNSLNLQVSSGTASITVTGGANHTINAKVVPASNTTISVANTASLSLAGGLDNSAGKAVALSNTSSGSLSLAAVTNNAAGVVTVKGDVAVTGPVSSSSGNTGTLNVGTVANSNATLSAQRIIQSALHIGRVPTSTDTTPDATVTIHASTPNNYVAPGDTTVPTGNSSGTSVLNSLTIANDGSGIAAVPGTGATASNYYGTLDLQNNNLVIDYTGTANPVDKVRGAIQAAFNGGGWNGRGLTSTLIAANPSAQYALGYSDNADPNNQFGAFASFDGTTVSSTSILVKFTWQDDLNLDGTVDINDASIFANTYDNGATTGHTFATADLNYDGVVDINDASIFANSYIVSPPLATLPEPSTFVLGVLGLLGLGFVARRKQNRVA